MKYFAIIAFVFLLFACYGWGYALTRWVAIRDKDYFAFLSVVGVASLIFLGGVLNLVRLAYPAALGMLLLSGLTFFVIRCLENAKIWLATWRTGSLVNPENLKSMAGDALPIAILITAVGFYALTLLPAAAFNYGDDFQIYIPRPLRMLQTGTMTGDPFEILGIDLGAHAFLHGFVLLWFPIEYLLGFDAVFSFALTGLLLIAIGKKFNLHWSYTTLVLAGFIVINPQAVNISALYTGSAIILGILFASCYLFDQMEKLRSDGAQMVSSGILGLFLAGAIALKTSFVSYAFAYSTFFFIGLLLISKDKRKALKICSLVMLSAFVALLPWLALHAHNYASAIHAVLHPSIVAVDNEAHLPKGNITQLFSTKNLFYGGSFLSYGIIVLMLSVVGSYTLFNIFGNKITPSQRGYLLVAAASCAAGTISYFFNSFVAAPEMSVRYSCPILIATLPFAWLAAPMAVSNTAHPVKLMNLPGIKVAMMLSMPLLIIILFWSNFISRIERAYYQHMTLSFPISDTYIEYNHYVASPDAKQAIRKIQHKAQPAQKILAWIFMPGHLDFSRNEIYSVNAVGLVNPWIDMPLNGNVNDMVQYLKEQGIRYIMWEYKGNYDMVKMYRRDLSNPFDGYKTQGERALYLRRMLSLIMNGGSLLYYANNIVLFDLQQVK